MVGHDLYTVLPSDEVGKRLAKLAKLDWHRTNLLWAGVVGSEKEIREKDGTLTAQRLDNHLQSSQAISPVTETRRYQ